MGVIGEPQREIEVIPAVPPVWEPMPEPVIPPVHVPDREPVPV